MASDSKSSSFFNFRTAIILGLVVFASLLAAVQLTKGGDSAAANASNDEDSPSISTLDIVRNGVDGASGTTLLDPLASTSSTDPLIIEGINAQAGSEMNKAAAETEAAKKETESETAAEKKASEEKEEAEEKAKESEPESSKTATTKTTSKPTTTAKKLQLPKR